LAITAPELVEFVFVPINPTLTLLPPVVAVLPSPNPEIIVPELPVLYPAPNKFAAALSKVLAELLFKAVPLPPVKLSPVVPLENELPAPPNPKSAAALAGGAFKND